MRRSRGSIVLKLALVSASIVVALVASELVARFTGKERFDSQQAEARASELVTQISGNAWVGAKDDAPVDPGAGGWHYRLHPYYGYDLDDADDSMTSELEHFTKPRAQWTYDVLVLGGSVAQGFGKFAKRPIEQALEADPRFTGWEVRVYDQGRGGFHQPQQLHLLEYLLSIGFKPDVVIELDGFNEVALGVQNAKLGMHPALPSASHWAHLATTSPTKSVLDAMLAVRREQVNAESWLARAHAWHLFDSALASRWTFAQLTGARAKYAEAYAAYQQALAGEGEGAYFRGPKFDASNDDAVLAECARLWRDSSIEMDAICRVHGIRYLHCLQPTLHDEGSKPLTPEEIADGREPADWAESARRGYPVLRGEIERLRAANVEFLDLSRAFEHVETRLYGDVCHFSAEGQHMLAERVVAELVEHPPPPAPPHPTREREAKANGK